MFATLQVVILAALTALYSADATVLPRQLPDNCARTYTVQLGDVCDSISAAHNVSTFQLAHVNSNIDPLCDNLALGEPLCLGITGQDCQTIHVVQSGDFCALIATEAGIDTSTLLANNPNVLSDCSNIYPGEVLCTASDVIAYTNATSSTT
ncbi:hypothetical protein C8Q75DRAFT_294400 [Abortiporus biennis]|nr:hypothetical protein C8Q75DRAFT_294400 [Abortiporus biennis]